MCVENLEAPLLFLFLSVLVRIQLFYDYRGVVVVVGNRRILEYDRDAIVPAPVLCGVIPRLSREHSRIDRDGICLRGMFLYRFGDSKRNRKSTTDLTAGTILFWNLSRVKVCFLRAPAPSKCKKL
jgi:hypothetical protein